MMQRKSKDYSDIINLPHPVSKKHPQMSLYDRAAQFSPFSALTGHEAAIAETGRVTEERTELDEDAKERLDEKLQNLLFRLQVCGSEGLPIRVTYFVPDEKKEGGAYQEYTGSLKRLDAYARALIFSDATEISLDAVYDIAEDTK